MPSGAMSSGRSRDRPSRPGKAVGGFLALLRTVQDKEERHLRKLLGVRTRRAAGHGRAVGAMVAAVSHWTLRKGKRLRPALVALGLRAASARGDLRLAVEAGAALELLHTYLLIHDDWMDDDAVRRGGPTVT